MVSSFFSFKQQQQEERYKEGGTTALATSDESSDGESSPPDDELGKKRTRRGRPKGQSKKTFKKQRFVTEVRPKKDALRVAPPPPHLQQEAEAYDLDRPLTWIYGIRDLDRMSPADHLFLEEHLGYSFATSGVKILLATPHDLARRKTASISSTDDSKEEDVSG